MSDQYVFELQFKGESRENQFVIIDGGSMADFSKLKEDLKKCYPEPFNVKYLDDEDDIVSIDLEDEFKEFAKLAKQRSSRGMLIKLILDSRPFSDLLTSNQPAPTERRERNQDKSASTSRVDKQGQKFYNFTKQDLEEAMGLFNDMTDVPSEHLTKVWADKMKSKIKSELKKELLTEMKSQLGLHNHASGDTSKDDAEFEEDSDGNMLYLPEKRMVKLLHHQKKLEKKEKHVEAKIDQRLEKLEIKKMKLQAALRASATYNRKPILDSKMCLPCIMSAIATKESTTLPKRVTVGKVFVHLWHIINDGTVAWSNVELRHTWSSPGLEPDELAVKCLPMIPGQEGQIAMKFKAPKSVGPFVSYWHFFYQVDTHWQQFGHYVSINGNTKLSKLALSAGASNKVQDGNKKQKLDTKTVSFSGDAEKSSETADNVKLLNEATYQLQMDATKQLEASLASAQIAAEMAREAANAAFRCGKQAAVNTKPSEIEKMNECVENVVTSVQELNLLDSGSDTDANMDTNEEADPGFVIVNIPSVSGHEKTNSQLKNIHVFLGHDSSMAEKETNAVNTEEKDENIAATQLVDKKEKKEVNGNVMENSDLMTEERNERVENDEPQVGTSEFNMYMDPSGYNNTEASSQQPLSFPRLDPNVNYPVFPPPRVSMSVYSPQHPTLTHHPLVQHPPNPYPVFTPQHVNSSSPAIVFPPPPSLHFSSTKMNPPMYYPQIPTYPPMTGSSHHGCVPLVTMPPPTALSETMMPPLSQMAPQMNLGPVQQQMMGSFPLNAPVRGCTYVAPPTTSATGESNASSSSTTTSILSSKTTSVGSNFMDTAINTAPQVFETVTVENATAPIPSSHNAAGQNEGKSADNNKKVDSAGQILPQSLVDGAINVAATAYSTAWNALNNLRPKDGETVEFDPVFENNMAVLAEMGFNNLERNARLLKRFNNDISQVIGVICVTGGATNLDID